VAEETGAAQETALPGRQALAGAAVEEEATLGQRAAAVEEAE